MPVSTLRIPSQAGSRPLASDNPSYSPSLKRNGSVGRALASYNAGDGNVDTWTTPGRDDPDVFTEYVPFDETHKYVEGILQYWWINRYIWAGS